MPAHQKVSVAWQIVFTFIPFLDLWAFFRIRKLRRYLLLIYLIPLVFYILFTLSFGDSTAYTQYGSYYPLSWFLPSLDVSYPEIIGTIASWFFTGLAVYLVIIWSRQHNKRFDGPKTQQGGVPG